jgi:hypothetical protein
MNMVKKFCQVAALAWVFSSVGFVYAGSEIATLDSFINGSSTTLNGKQALTFYLGGDQSNYCDITATAEYVTQSNGILVNVRRNQPDFDVSCTWGGEYYVISSKHQSRADLTITKPDGGPSRFSLTGFLVTVKGERLELHTPAAIPLAKKKSTP